MKILAIDYSARHVGLALSDDEQGFAFPYNTLTLSEASRRGKVSRRDASTSKNVEKLISDIKNICKIENVERIIVGMPINLSGEKTKTTEVVFNFVKELEKALDMPVEVEDERLTSVQASRLKNKNAHNEHELSAQILLQSWLDKNI